MSATSIFSETTFQGISVMQFTCGPCVYIIYCSEILTVSKHIAFLVILVTLFVTLFPNMVMSCHVQCCFKFCKSTSNHVDLSY